MHIKSLRKLTPLLSLFLALTAALAKAQQAPMPSVTVSEVAATDWHSQLQALGTVAAREHIVITSRVNGFIDQLNFTDGETVVRGQSLIELDSQLEQARLLEAEVQLQEDLRRLKELELLYDKKAVSQSELEAQKATVSRSEAQLKAATTTLSFYSLEAPFNGMLSTHSLSRGQYISPGDKLVSLTNLDDLYIDFMLPSKYLSQITEELNLELSFSAWPDHVFSATIATIDPTIDPQSRNLKVRAQLDNSDALLRPGLLAQVTLNLPSENVIAIDTSSIFYRGSQAYVYLVNMNGQAFEHPINTSAIYGEVALIDDGLTLGDNIISVGVGKVRNGMQVTPAQITADNDNPETEEVVL